MANEDPTISPPISPGPDVDAIALIEEKIIFGLANSNDAYIYNSVWLNLMSIFVLPGKILIF